MKKHTCPERKLANNTYKEKELTAYRDEECQLNSREKLLPTEPLKWEVCSIGTNFPFCVALPGSYGRKEDASSLSKKQLESLNLV